MLRWFVNVSRVASVACCGKQCGTDGQKGGGTPTVPLPDLLRVAPGKVRSLQAQVRSGFSQSCENPRRSCLIRDALNAISYRNGDECRVALRSLANLLSMSTSNVSRHTKRGRLTGMVVGLRYGAKAE